MPIYVPSRVEVYGYTQQFLICPAVQIFWNGSLIGSVRKGELLTFDVEGDGEVSFKSSMRRAALMVRGGRTTKIKLSWDRISGRLIPQVVESVTPGH